MGRVLVVYEEGMPKTYHILMDVIKEYFERDGFVVEMFCIKSVMTPDEYGGKFADQGWEYICTLDMAGFQISTVLECPRYNIMSAKQIHIVIDRECFLLYQDASFALNLYLFMPETMREERLEELFIPNLYYYKPFELKEGSIQDRDELLRILEMVRKECEMPCG